MLKLCWHNRLVSIVFGVPNVVSKAVVVYLSRVKKSIQSVCMYKSSKHSICNAPINVKPTPSHPGIGAWGFAKPVGQKTHPRGNDFLPAMPLSGRTD